MANLTYRVANPIAPASTTTKGEPLLNTEIDGNFKSLDDAKLEKTGGNITGNVTVSGIVSATDFNSTSDARLKTDITEIKDALSKIKLIAGYNFRFLESVSGTNGGLKAGVIAQEVIQHMPEVVDSSSQYYQVSYDALIPYLIEAITELDKKIDQLKS